MAAQESGVVLSNVETGRDDPPPPAYEPPTTPPPRYSEITPRFHDSEISGFNAGGFNGVAADGAVVDVQPFPSDPAGIEGEVPPEGNGRNMIGREQYPYTTRTTGTSAMRSDGLCASCNGDCGECLVACFLCRCLTGGPGHGGHECSNCDCGCCGDHEDCYCGRCEIGGNDCRNCDCGGCDCGDSHCGNCYCGGYNCGNCDNCDCCSSS